MKETIQETKHECGEGFCFTVGRRNCPVRLARLLQEALDKVITSNKEIWKDNL